LCINELLKREVTPIVLPCEPAMVGYVRRALSTTELLRLDVAEVDYLLGVLVVELDGVGVAILVCSVPVGNDVNPNGAFVVLVLGD